LIAAGLPNAQNPSRGRTTYSTTFGKRILTVHGVQQRNEIWSSSSGPFLSCASPLPKGTRIGPKGRFSAKPVVMSYTYRQLGL
jgi:hypothetical protein